MKPGLLLGLIAGLSWVWASQWRRAWVFKTNQYADGLITKNRAQAIRGMAETDEALRDANNRRRLQQETAAMKHYLDELHAPPQEPRRRLLKVS